MPNSLLKLFLAGENGLFYHYSLMNFLADCTLQEYRYFAKLDNWFRHTRDKEDLIKHNDKRDLLANRE